MTVHRSSRTHGPTSAPARREPPRSTYTQCTGTPKREHTVRRFAGARSRHLRIFLVPLLATGCGGLVGLYLGYVLFHPGRAAGSWLSVAGAGAAVALTIAAGWFVLRSLERGPLRGLERGNSALYPTTEVIEHALAAPNCAIAHNVSAIAKSTGIDHLVATPVRLWVIATKHRPGPREHFPEVLRRVADNTTAVWDWAPPGTPVRGCVVLAYESRIQRKKYDYGKEPIVVHTLASLADELRAEANQPPELDEQVAAEVWKLARNAG